MYPADMQCVDWLRWFTNDDHDETQHFFRLPGGRTAATSGYFAVVTAEKTAKEPVTLVFRKMIPELIVGMLETPAIKSNTLSRTRMMDLFGECDHPRSTVCSECKGEKIVPHDCGCYLCEANQEECGECDGKGAKTELPETRPVNVWSEPINANLVAYVLAHAPAAEEYVLSIIRTYPCYLRIHTPRWDAIVGGLNTSHEGIPKSWSQTRSL